jgi:hypothetical protein
MPSSQRCTACRLFATVLAAFVLLQEPAKGETDAPDPGGSESAEIFPLAEGKAFGFRGMFQLSDISAADYTSLIRTAGGNTARMNMTWWGLEPVRDVWAEQIWANYGTVYREFVAAGITPHFTIENAPPWARDLGAPQLCLDGDVCSYPPAQSELAEWKEFVVEVTTRFPLARIEIWNEPNFAGGWRSGPDPERYATLLASAYDAIKAANPSAQVISGGLGESIKPGGIALREFLDRAYAATPSIEDHMDALNFHTYPGPRLGENSEFAATMRDVREIRAKYGDTSTPLFVSETGYTTTGPIGVSQREQSGRLLRTVAKLMSMDDVSAVLVNSMIERPEHAPDEHERGFGLLNYSTDQPFRPKVAYCDLSRASGQDHAPCSPIARVDSGPQGIWNQPAAEFTFSAGEPASFRCSLDGEAFEPCSSPTRYEALTEGAHTFRVKGTDTAGRVDVEPDERSFEIDLQAPETSISGPSGPVASNVAKFQLSTPDSQATFECSMDGEAFESCSSPYLNDSLGEGIHEFRARAVDPSGNADPTPASSRFTVDTHTPQVNITGGPSGPTAESQPRFDFSANEPDVSFRCGFDSEIPGTNCTAATGFAPPLPLGHGPHTFLVMAIDAAGNRSEVLRQSFDVDLRGPVVSITGPADPINSRTAALTSSFSEPTSSVECRYDSAASFTPCSGQAEFASVSEGRHWFRVRATDQLGNLGPIAVHAWTVDTRAPDTSIHTEGSLEGIAELSGEIRSTESGSSFECDLDDRGFIPCGSAIDLSGLTAGPHRLEARAIDGAGNIDSTPAVISFSTINSTLIPPVVSTVPDLTSGAAISVDSITFVIEPDPSAEGAECRMNQLPWESCTGSVEFTGLAEGWHRFEARSTGGASNSSAISAFELEVDLTPPETQVVRAPKRVPRKSSATFAFTSSEEPVTYRCALDKKAFSKCGESHSFKRMSRGNHVLRVVAKDRAGLSDLTPARHRFRVR